jgi:hypothetical protein
MSTIVFPTFALYILLFMQLTLAELILDTLAITMPLVLASVVKYLQLIKKYGYLNLGRGTISEAVRYLDLRSTPLSQVESVVDYRYSHVDIRSREKEGQHSNSL